LIDFPSSARPIMDSVAGTLFNKTIISNFSPFLLGWTEGTQQGYIILSCFWWVTLGYPFPGSLKPIVRPQLTFRIVVFSISNISNLFKIQH
jgi:hypothetical protein